MWGILNMWGIALVVPIYYFTNYVLTPLSTFDAADMRRTNRLTTQTILPSLLATHYATFTAAYLAPSSAHRQAAGFLWELFPVGLSACQALFVLRHPSTQHGDRLSPVTRDLPIIRATIIALCAISGGVWQYTLWSNCGWSSLIDVFVPVLGFRSVHTQSFEARFAEFLKWDQVFFVMPNMAWIGLLYRDMHSEGWIHAPWWKVLGAMIVLTVVGGDGAMLGVMWLYREEVLASKRHPAAVVRQPSDEQKRKEA
jgi:hypothetical protein